jgi:hypothetical protein
LQHNSLHNFEFKLAGSVYEKAMELTQQGAVHQLREVEKHFWVASVTDEDGTYESEVIISPGKIKAFACGCWTEPRKLMCAHIAATLFKIRQFLNQRAEEKARQAEEKATRSSERLTISEVLDQAPAAALIDFVRHYARRDSNFNLAVKTWFAGHLDRSENTFALVLGTALPKIAAKMRTPDWRRINQTLGDLEVQLKNAHTNGDRLTIYRISIAILLKLGPYFNTLLDPQRAIMLGEFTRARNALQDMVADQEVPVELRQQIWNELFLNMQSEWWPGDLTREASYWIAQSSMFHTGAFERISSTFFEQSPPNTTLLYAYLVALALRGHTVGPKKVLAALSEGGMQEMTMSDLAKNGILALYYHRGCDEATSKAILFFIEKSALSADTRRELEDLLLNIGERNPGWTLHWPILSKRFAQSGQMSYLDKLRHSAGVQWPTQRAELIQSLQSAGKAPFVAALLAADGETTVLAAYLYEHPDLNLMKQYAGLLPPADLQNLYFRGLGAYLESYFGQPGTAAVAQIVAELKKTYGLPFAQQIIQRLKMTYPERSGLSEALDEAMLPLKRNSWS